MRWRMRKGKESSTLDGCQHADSVCSELEIGYTEQEERMWRSRALTTAKTFLWWMELSAHGRGAVEGAFKNENSDVIMETYVAAEVCRAVKDFGCEFLRGQ